MRSYNPAMFVSCNKCGWSGDVPLRSGGVRARYKCYGCRRPVTTLSVFTWSEWLEQHADRLELRRREGRLGSRRQSSVEADRDISVAGVAAEFAACLILAPWKLEAWIELAESD